MRYRRLSVTKVGLLSQDTTDKKGFKAFHTEHMQLTTARDKRRLWQMQRQENTKHFKSEDELLQCTERRDRCLVTG